MCDPIQINHIGVIPKKLALEKWRLTTDLSFPSWKGVNDGIDPDTTTLSYIRVDEVAKGLPSTAKILQYPRLI